MERPKYGVNLVNNLNVKVEDAKKYFNLLWSSANEGLLPICAKGSNGLLTKFFTVPIKDAAHQVIERWSSQDVYVSVGLLQQRPESGRGKESDVIAIAGLWMDIDCSEGSHKEQKLPSKEEGLSFLKELPFKPSLIVWSGGGLHVYWIFKEILYFHSEADRQQAKELSSRFQLTIISMAKSHGWNLDNTADLVRLLRIPGTHNFKRDPVAVKILEMNDFRYELDDFEDFLIDKEPQGDGPDVRNRRIYEIVEQCGFLRHCRNDAKSLPEPDWWSMVCSLCFEGGSGPAIHELSKNYPGYSKHKTDAKIIEALKQSGPMTCQRIREKTGFDGCPGGCDVTSPIHLRIEKNKGHREKSEKSEKMVIEDLENRQWQKWPKLGNKALAGFAGRFVKLASRNSESDPAAILITFLGRFAVECGSKSFIFIGDSKHFSRIFAVIVGATSKASKGTSSKPVKRLFTFDHLHLKENDFIIARDSPGPLSSGEGLIWSVRDEMTSYKLDTKTKIGEEVVTDPGIKDKRLFVLDEEFSSALISSKREGNTLSTILRSIWDSGNLEPLTKNNRIKSTNAHIGICSHITLHELHQKLDEVQVFSGFANRFLWVCARRQCEVPFPEPMPDKELLKFQQELFYLVKKAQAFKEIKFSEEAKEKWDDVYHELSGDHSGLIGAVIDRAEAQVIRLSIIYTLLDGRDTICVDHLESALTVWKYCEDSAKFIFSGREINPFSNKIFELLRFEGEKTVTEIYEHFNRHITKKQLEQAITELLSQKKIEIEKIQTSGRPRTVFKISEGQKDSGLDFTF